ncbi:MAG: M23 family metallopeptidase [Pseudomonadota bacterium]
MTGPFGYRKDPFNRRSAFHDGIDLQAPMRTPVYAAAAGTVIAAGMRPAYGREIEIDHGFGIHTRYAHLSALNVREGRFLLPAPRAPPVMTLNPQHRRRADLPLRSFLPAEAPRAAIVALHGFNDYSNAFLRRPGCISATAASRSMPTTSAASAMRRRADCGSASAN